MSSTATATDPYVGRTVLGRYRIVRMIAAGGMGRIYLARTEGAAGFVRPMVIKRVLPELVGDDSMVKMFEREARIMASLRHPGIIAVSDFEREGDDYLLAMEYVHGYNLARWLRYITATRGSFPVEVAVHIAIQVLDALHYAHTLADVNGTPMVIVHRDVTPGNILIDTQGHVKVLDFGIARSNNDATQPDGDGPKVKGKFAYTAPEVFAGAEPSPRSDVYSVGVVLHEVLTGKNEMSGKDMQTTVFNTLKVVPRRLDTVRSDVTLGLAEVVARALAKNPDDRFESAHDFAVALRAVRTVSTDTANEQLASMAAADFRDPRLAEQTGVEDLSTLDRAWRASLRPPPTIELSGEPRVSADRSGPTLSAAASDVAPTGGHPAASAGGIRRWVPAISAVVAVGACAALAVVLLRDRDRDRDPTAAQYVYIEGNRPGALDASSTVGAASTPPTGETPGADPVVAAAPDAARVRPSGSTRAHPGAHATTPDPTATLTRTFAREQSRITRCFENNASDVEGNPEIAVRFELDPSGHVGSAQIVPARYAGTRFGACILGVARAVRFGPQSAPIAFRIPITVRRGGGH